MNGGFTGEASLAKYAPLVLPLCDAVLTELGALAQLAARYLGGHVQASGGLDVRHSLLPTSLGKGHSPLYRRAKCGKRNGWKRSKRIDTCNKIAT